MKKLGLGLITVLAASVLVACGGGGGGGVTLGATSNVTAPVTASSVGAVTSQAFTFSSGVTSLGTASATTVTLNSATTFSISSAEGTASGDLSFGSCIFKVTASTYSASSALAVGKTIEVQPCSLNVATAGLTAEQTAVARAVSFILGGNASQTRDLQVDISPTGTVTVNGTTIGTVTLTPVTGA